MKDRTIGKNGQIVKLFPETIEELKKVEGELQAQNGHAKTHDDAIKALLEEHRRRAK